MLALEDEREMELLVECGNEEVLQGAIEIALDMDEHELIDALIESEPHLMDAVREHAKSEDAWVRSRVAAHGYCLDLLIEDADEAVADAAEAFMHADNDTDDLDIYTVWEKRHPERLMKDGMDLPIASLRWTRADLADAIERQGGERMLALGSCANADADALADAVKRSAIKAASDALDAAAARIIQERPQQAAPALRKIPDLEGAIEKHRLWLQGDPKGVRADLSYSDLANADFRVACMRKASFRGADLTGANMRGVNVSHADMREACLDEVHMQGGFARGADFSHARMRGVVMERAYLRDAILDGAIVTDACFSQCDMRDMRADGATFDGVRFEHITGDMGFMDQAVACGCEREQASPTSPARPRLRDAGARCKGASAMRTTGDPRTTPTLEEKER